MTDTLIDEMMADVPRGKEAGYLTEQYPPQARFIQMDAILRSEALTYDPKNPQGKILLGAVGDKLIGVKDNRHVLTVAGSRAGKSITIIANEFFYDGSLIALDPKGEQAMLTAMAREKLGQDVHIIDPFGIIRGEAIKYRSSFNFLASLARDNPHVIEDTHDIVDAIIINATEERDPHWNDAAGEFLTGLILHACFSKEIADDARHLGTVRHLAMSALQKAGQDDPYVLAEAMLKTSDDMAADKCDDIAIAIADSTHSFFEKKGAEMASVISSLRRHLKFLAYPSIRNVVARHDFDLRDLKRNPKGISVYIVLPATRMGMCNRLFRLFLNRVLADMEREEAKPPQDVLMVLDEFAVLGHSKQLEDAAGQIASFGVKLWVVLQDWGQGVALYNQRFESFAANAGIFQAFGNVDNLTTDYISAKLGNTAVKLSTTSEASAENREQGLTGRSASFEQFPLLTPDEIARTFARSDPLKRQLIMLAGKHPMVIQRVEHFDPEGPLAKSISF